MNRILFIILAITFFSVTAMAGEVTKEINSDGQKITVRVDQKEDKPVTIITRNNEIRVYPCGKVEKLVWKEINPNEDDLTSPFVMWDVSGATIACIDENGNAIPYE